MKETVRLSARARALSPSPTVAADARAKELAAAGRDLVNLTAGEPDFATPDHIADAAVTAIRAGYTHYTAPEGARDCREAVCVKLKRDNGLEYRPEQVVVTVGAKQAIFNALQVLCDPGDEVLIPAPYWVSYTEQVKLAGGVPVPVPTDAERGFCCTAADLAAHLSPRTRLLILNSPNNPTGAVYPAEELRAIAALAREHDLTIISDEIYEAMVYDGARHVSVAGFAPERTVLVNGLSKAYAMTGWRVGYAVGDPAVIRAMVGLQSQTTSNIASIAQKAAVAALTGPQEPVRAMVAQFAARRRYVLDRLAHMPYVRCAPPAGAFYVFPDVSACFGRGCDGPDAFAARLLEEAGLAVVSGTAFGSDRHVRISYAAAQATLERGMDRLEEFLRRL
jgi:aspartate aminotransferase